MSFFYFDSSALVKRYLTEIGSTWVSALTALSAGHTTIMAEITRVEVAAALASRHRASGGITRKERDDAVDLLLKHWDSEYRVLFLMSAIISRAVNLTQHHKLRGYDAVQLATALVVHDEYSAAGLPALTFVAADDDLIAAARAERLAAENPNNHP